MVVVLQLLRLPVEPPAGVDDGERQVVLDVGVHPGQRELQRVHLRIGALLEQRPPAGRGPPPRRDRVHRQQVAPGEEHVQLGHGGRIGEPAQPGPDALGDRQVHPVEDRHPVGRRKPGRDRPQPPDHVVDPPRPVRASSGHPDHPSLSDVDRVLIASS